MLSAADNEYLCRVGPGTPMGKVFREYWLPAVRSDELPSPDCPPMRVRLRFGNCASVAVLARAYFSSRGAYAVSGWPVT